MFNGHKKEIYWSEHKKTARKKNNWTDWLLKKISDKQ